MLPLPDTAALVGADGSVLDRQLIGQRVDRMAQVLSHLPADKPLALAGDNSPDWIIADLAAARLGHALVPVPAFFTLQQRTHVCSSAGIEHVICDGQVLPVANVWPDIALPAHRDPSTFAALPTGTQKVTFTSGTTGQPKGICLTWGQQMLTVQSLVERLGSLNIGVHLNLLPLAVLLENIAGVLAPLSMGATVVTPPLDQVGLRGSSDFDPVVCLQAIAQYRAESVILLPQMLAGLVAALDAKLQLRGCIKTLRFVAVGGAPVPVAVLERARAIGIPVYEGYGLTECASVVCLNSPHADCPGTVGTPLPGLQCGLNEHGEVWVEGRNYAGVLGATAHRGTTDTAESEHAGRIMTGDLGEWVERDGKRFLRIIGRQKNILITAFGRNVSPEWPERLLMETGLFRQAVVVGDGQPALDAVLVSESALSVAQVESAVGHVNEQLPDYARIARWQISNEPFTQRNGLATANGRPLRSRIAAQFASALSE